MRAARRVLVAGFLAAAFVLTAGEVGEAQAGSFPVVNDTGDASDLNLADPDCDVSVTAGQQCTLRAAIEQSNDEGGLDILSFNVPGGGTATITPQTKLPNFTSPVIIDGYGQPGSSPNTQPFGKPLDSRIKVFIDGSDTDGQSGLTFAAGSEDSEVRGLAIGKFDINAIATLSDTEIIVQGNYLGTNAKGTKSRSVLRGISASGIFGGGAPEDRNVIAGANDVAITARTATIEGNYIGVGADAKTPLTNSSGIRLFGLEGGIVVENIIAHTEGDAVETRSDLTGTRISSNRIFDNAGIGIDLVQLSETEGPTPNDDDESDQIQNSPTLTSVTREATTTRIFGRLDSLPDTQYFLEIFEADGKSRQGKRLIGTGAFDTDDTGTATIDLNISKRMKKGKFVTATATNLGVGPSGATSEFSKPQKVK